MWLMVWLVHLQMMLCGFTCLWPSWLPSSSHQQCWKMNNTWCGRRSSLAPKWHPSRTIPDFMSSRYMHLWIFNFKSSVKTSRNTSHVKSRYFKTYSKGILLMTVGCWNQRYLISLIVSPLIIVSSSQNQCNHDIRPSPTPTKALHPSSPPSNNPSLHQCNRHLFTTPTTS